MGNKDKTRDGDAAADNRDHSWDQESRDAVLAKTITEAVAQQTQSITEMFAKQNREAAKETQSILPKHLQGKWRRLMCNIRTYLRKLVQPPYQLPLKSLLQQMALE